MSNSLCYVFGLVVLQLANSAFAVDVHSNEDQWKKLKEKVQTFGQFTEEVGHEISPATQELLRNFKDRKISLIIERSRVYQNAAAKINNEYKDSVESLSYLVNSVEYSFQEDSPSIIRATREAAAKSKVIILVMSLRLAKECLVAAYDLKLHIGDHVFVTYEVNVLNMLSFQRRSFKWPIVSYTTSINETYHEYILRSRKLCWMLEQTFVVMVTLPKHFTHILKERVPKLYRRDRRIVLDSVDMWKGIENIQFSIAGHYRVFITKNGNLKYPLAVYRYGTREGSGTRCANLLTNMLSKTSSSNLMKYPKMHHVASFKVINEGNCASCSETWKLSLTRRNKSRTHKHFRGDVSIDLNKPTCDDRKCVVGGKAKFPRVETIFVICVAVILFIACMCMYRQYRKLQQKQYDEGKYLIPSEVKLVEDPECKQPVNV